MSEENDRMKTSGYDTKQLRDDLDKTHASVLRLIWLMRQAICEEWGGMIRLPLYEIEISSCPESPEFVLKPPYKEELLPENEWTGFCLEMADEGDDS